MTLFGRTALITGGGNGVGAAIARSLHAAGAGVVVVGRRSEPPGPVEGARMDRNFRLEAERTGSGYGAAREAFVSRAALGRMVTEEEVGAAVVAMLGMPGLCGADIDLSAGMIA